MIFEEKMVKNRYYLIFSMIIFSLVIAGCAEDEEMARLKAVEIKEYEGEKLGSIGDFRENSIKGPQRIDMSRYHLEVSGLVDDTLKLTYDQVLENSRYTKLVTLDCVEGWSVKALWGGVLIKDIIKKAGLKKEAKTVIFYAYDGYSTSFPIEYIMNNDILLAYRLNNVTLPEEKGFPFQLVAEQKWGYKWIKWVTKIELSNNTAYKGYWESRGYSNDGDLNKSSLSR